MIISTMAVLTLLSSCNGGQSKGNDSALDLVVGTYGHNLYELSFNPDGSFGPMKAIPAGRIPHSSSRMEISSIML